MADLSWGLANLFAIMDNRTGMKQSDKRRKPGRVPLRQRARAIGTVTAHELNNAQLAELFAQQAGNAHPPLTRAFRRADVDSHDG